MESCQKFQKIHKIYSVEVNCSEDLIILAERILTDPDPLVSYLRSSKNQDLELADDLLRLIEGIREDCVKEESQKYKDLVYLVVSNWLGQKSVTLSSFVVNRLYKRGFNSIIVDSFLKYWYDSVETERTEEFVSLCVSERSESTLLMCCNALRYLSKFLYVEYYEGEHYMCIDSHRDYNVLRRVIGVMFGSHLRWEGKWNHRALPNLFHPFSRTYLPCLVLYVIIDLLEDEINEKLLEIISFYYADSELMRTVQVNQITYLAGCICRLLNSTKVSQGFDFRGLSKSLTKAVTNGFTTLDPVIRVSALRVAETYSEFLYNNSQIKDESLLFKYDEGLELDSPITFQIAVSKSKLTVNPDFSKIKKIQKVEKNEEDNKVLENDLVKDENEEFIDYIFQGVPRIKLKTVDGYVKNSWLRPPQHIVQCFERMLSKPARGDIDYECLNKHELDRIESEKVEEKILRISQTLLYLPKIIEKKESILERYAVPLTNILLKLDDLDLYTEKMEEIVEKSRNKVLVEESGLEELVNASEFLSKDPQVLILLSLVLITYHCPSEMVKFHSSHLFDKEYSLSMRITMLLCVQYTAIAFNGGLDQENLKKKVVEDTENMTDKNQTISTLQTCNPIRDYGKIESEITLLPKQKINSEASGCTGISLVFTRNFNNMATSLLLDSLGTYSKNQKSQTNNVDEDIVVGIFETLIILVISGSIEAEILRELKEMADYFESMPRGQRFKNTLEVLSMMVSTVPHQS